MLDLYYIKIISISSKKETTEKESQKEKYQSSFLLILNFIMFEKKKYIQDSFIFTLNYCQ